ncbi:MAG: hypothetical protein HQL59_08895 [Magnetococcales bacterium]|nr:hypothetical protein [Magnetococcales bacterium]
MLTFADRVKESAAVSGAGAYILNGAVPGHQGFVEALGGDRRCAWCAERGSLWEVGEGIVDAAGGTLSRERILSSSNAGAAVDWPAGSVVALFCVAPAEVIQRGVRSGVTVTTPGMLRVQPGSARWYPPMAVTFTAWEAWVGQAPGGVAAQFTLRKNGLSVAFGSIVAGSQRMSHDAISLSLTPDDWLTLDITQTGVSPPGSDLTVRLIP